VLLVEDEPLIAENLLYALQTEGFQAHHRATLGEAEKALESTPIDLVVLDINLPDGNGFDFFHIIHDRFAKPVIFLTARSSEIDRVLGLEMGGDDYVVKPVSPRELAARVKAVLRRTLQPEAGVKQTSIQSPPAHGFGVDEDAKTINYEGTTLELSACEYRLLQALLARPGKIFSRDELLHQAWEDPGASMDRTIDAHIKNLRRKIGAIDPDAQVIKTHRGFGYSLENSP
jgi:two-component system catabolic regulation response regulator CreB